MDLQVMSLTRIKFSKVYPLDFSNHNFTTLNNALENRQSFRLPPKNALIGRTKQDKLSVSADGSSCEESVGRPRKTKMLTQSRALILLPEQPLPCNSGTTMSTNSSSPAGSVGNMMLNPSRASPSSQACISSAMLAGVPTNCSPP
jgi:hypothetical protein